MNRWQREYEKWRDHNLYVLDVFEHYARQALATGRPFSISLLTERVRWEEFMAWRTGDGGYKINNNFRSYIARDLVQRLPQLRKVFRFRKVGT